MTLKITTVHPEILARVKFGDLLQLADFILAIISHVSLSMLRMKQNGGFYIGRCHL